MVSERIEEANGNGNGNGHGLAHRHKAPTPLKLSGALDKFEYEDTTTVIGREYPTVNIVDDLLDNDELLRDLAITISRRGVVFFRNQSNLTNELQKKLVQRLGELSGKPASSTLHVHPVLNSSREFGVPGDDQISTISSAARVKLLTAQGQSNRRKYDAARWHSDIQFEPAPADYTSLRLTQLPKTGGDTLWASGYELYDRFSKPYQQFLESLDAVFDGSNFNEIAKKGGYGLYTQERGSPANVGSELVAVHPVVRTNPVTGWKSIFAVGTFPKAIVGLHQEESEELLGRFLETVERNHDLQVRFKWRHKDDLAIWDNRSAFHSATFDYEGLGERFGNRAVGIGEEPYLDPKSRSRTEALAEAGEYV